MYELLLFLIIVFFILLYRKKPSNELDWKPQYALLPEILFSGNQISIKNIRDFRYDENRHIHQQNYLNKTYALSELESVWFGLSHFGPCGFAHAFMSFGFKDGDYLVISIETRLRTDQKYYHPLAGMFRNYTKIFLLATEQDIIGLRSHLRDEEVYLYELKLNHEDRKLLLLNFLKRAYRLNKKPVFYNTLIGNCLTGLLWESKHFNRFYQWLDHRVILPGYSDRLLYKKRALLDEDTFKEMRKKAKIKPGNYSIDDPDFSKKIRE